MGCGADAGSTVHGTNPAHGERWKKMPRAKSAPRLQGSGDTGLWALWRRCSFSSYHWRSPSTTEAKTPGWLDFPSPEEAVHVSVSVAGK